MSENVIFSYTAEDAIRDGVLIRPWDKRPQDLCTMTLWDALMSVKNEDPLRPNYAVLFEDALALAEAAPEEDMFVMRSSANPDDREVWVARNELGGMTLMFPEDY